MEDLKQHLSDISEMKSLLEKNTRFLSLSGLSGVVAGLFALAGAFAGYYVLKTEYYGRVSTTANEIIGLPSNVSIKLMAIAVIVLVGALSIAFFLTYRKAKRNGEHLLSPPAKRMLVNTAIPLCSGGLFSLVLVYYQLYGLVAPCMLIFYGLACVSASQHTLTEVRYIGLLNILLGFVNCFFLGQGLIFWALGFGVLHIVYGVLMHLRHDSKLVK